MKHMTSNNRVSYKPITAEDYREFYGNEAPSGTLRAMSFFIDNKLSAIAGVKYEGGYFTAFSDIKDDVDVDKQTIWRCALIMIDFIDSMNLEVYACANTAIDGAGRFLQRLGFKKIDDLYHRRAK